MKEEKQLMSLEDAIEYLKKQNYDLKALSLYTDTEIRVLATHQKARNE